MCFILEDADGNTCAEINRQFYYYYMFDAREGKL